MPTWGSVSAVEAIWTLAFGAALCLSVGANRAFAAVGRLPPVPGVPATAQGAMADYFVLLTRLLIVNSSAGTLLGVYAALTPPPPAAPPAWLAAVGGFPGPALICVMAGAMIWTAYATWRVYRAISHAVAVVPRKTGGRRAYDRRPDEEPEAP